MTSDQVDKILKELETLKKLRLFELLEKGYSQADLAKILGVNQSTISRMVPRAPSPRGRSRANG